MWEDQQRIIGTGSERVPISRRREGNVDGVHR